MKNILVINVQQTDYSFQFFYYQKTIHQSCISFLSRARLFWAATLPLFFFFPVVLCADIVLLPENLSVESRPQNCEQKVKKIIIFLDPFLCDQKLRESYLSILIMSSTQWWQRFLILGFLLGIKTQLHPFRQ